jgi:2-methylcitrate dehydratase PrpD
MPDDGNPGERPMSLTRTLCEKIAATDFEAIGPSALAAARQLVLDGMAVAVAGSGEPPIKILAEHYRSLGGTPEASVIGRGFRTSSVTAAAINGASMHVLDFEPMWSPANHALSTTLPAILALAQVRAATGREIVTALVKGCEIQGWIREASGQYEPRGHKFHPPGAVGPLGAAVAAGHLLLLDAGKLAHALGIAASRCGSLLSNVGTMTKSTHCGHAAALGLESALLAERGFTANTETFDAPAGYADAFYAGSFQPEKLLGFGPPFRVVRPGYALKMFPSQFGTHFVITAGIELHQKIGDPAAIQAVRITTPVMPYVDRPKPATGLAGKFSLQYAAASSLLDGRVTIATFHDARRFAPDVEALLPKVSLQMDPAIPARFEKMHIELEVTLRDGRTLRARCNGPRGIWGGDPVAPEEHLAKVRDCLSVRLAPGPVEQCVALAAAIDQLDSGGVAALLALVEGSGADAGATLPAAGERQDHVRL